MIRQVVQSPVLSCFAGNAGLWEEMVSFGYYVIACLTHSFSNKKTFRLVWFNFSSQRKSFDRLFYLVLRAVPACEKKWSALDAAVDLFAPRKCSPVVIFEKPSGTNWKSWWGRNHTGQPTKSRVSSEGKGKRHRGGKFKTDIKEHILTKLNIWSSVQWNELKDKKLLWSSSNLEYSAHQQIPISTIISQFKSY